MQGQGLTALDCLAVLRGERLHSPEYDVQVPAIHLRDRWKALYVGPVIKLNRRGLRYHECFTAKPLTQHVPESYRDAGAAFGINR